MGRTKQTAKTVIKKPGPKKVEPKAEPTEKAQKKKAKVTMEKLRWYRVFEKIAKEEQLNGVQSESKEIIENCLNILLKQQSKEIDDIKDSKYSTISPKHAANGIITHAVIYAVNYEDVAKELIQAFQDIKQRYENYNKK